jgi:hypothetical protein
LAGRAVSEWRPWEAAAGSGLADERDRADDQRRNGVAEVRDAGDAAFHGRAVNGVHRRRRQLMAPLHLRIEGPWIQLEHSALLSLCRSNDIGHIV